MERPQSVEGDRQEPSGSPEIAPEVPESPTSQQPGEGGTDPERTMPAQERHRGTVKWFNSSKGFGFITLDGSEEEIFVHQSNIEAEGFRSLREGEEVEFELAEGEDGKKKAFQVTGPEGAPPQGTTPSMRIMYGGPRGVGPRPLYDPYNPAAVGSMPGPAGGFVPGGYMSPVGDIIPGGRGRGLGPPIPGGAPPGPPGSTPGYSWPPNAYMGYYMPPPGAPPGYYPPGAQGSYYPRGRGGFFPGGRNWAGARPPPPGQPGFSSGLQVVVHNLPWDCTWQQLRDAFQECGEIERADVVFDSRGRSRGFGIVRFPVKEEADRAVERMNNASIGGRVVSVRVDRFA